MLKLEDFQKQNNILYYSLGEESGIEIHLSNEFEVYYIPQYGGNTIFDSSYLTIEEALKRANFIKENYT